MVEEDAVYLEPPSDDVEPPFDDVEPPFDDVEPPFDDVEPPFDDVEPPFDDVEPPDDEELPFDDEEPPYLSSPEEWAMRTIHVVDGFQTLRSYSEDEFGKILQLSQWSLRHRIEICKVLQKPTNHWIMSPLSRHGYAKQSLALIRKELKDISVESSIRDSSYQYGPYESEYLPPGEIEKEVKKLVYQDWKQLTKDLKVELKRLRSEDKNKSWYTLSLTRGQFFQAGDLYIAVEKGNEEDFKEMIRMIGLKHWANISPQEYRGATPLHWAVLHNHNCFPEALFGIENVPEISLASAWGGYYLASEWLTYAIEDYIETRDEFGFSLIHMAIFASSRLPFLPKQRSDLEKYELEKNTDSIKSSRSSSDCLHLLEMMIDLYVKRVGRPARLRPDSEFLIFKLASYKPYDRSSYLCFVAKHYFSTPIHFVHLAILIGHPRVIEKLMKRLNNSYSHMNNSYSLLMARPVSRLNNLFMARTECGDTILHLAAWGMDPNIESDYGARQRVMVTLLRNLHHYPSFLNSTNEAGQSPLHIATFQGSSECVGALLRCPYVKVDVKNKNGYTPSEIALKMHSVLEDEVIILGLVGGKSAKDIFKYDDIRINHPNSWEEEKKRNYRIVNNLMSKITSKILRQLQVLQRSQWSVKYRIFALQMLDEDNSNLENIKDSYTEQCLKLVSMGEERNDKLEHMSDEFRKKLAPYSKLHKIYTAIEEEDNVEFERLMDKLIGKWPESFQEYKGATPLHWAILYGRENMVSYINKYKVDKVHGHETWLAIVNAQDSFGFTPLHLAVLSTPFRFGYFEEEMKKSLRLIGKLCEMGVPHSISNTSESDFLVWRRTYESIYVDEYLSKSILYPISLAVHLAHPRIIEKLLEVPQDQVFAKNIMWAGDSILHRARSWEVLITECSEDDWNKIETLVLMHLDNLPKAVNSRNNNRDTPLHIAVRTKSAKWIEVLLQCEHVKFNFRNREKHSPGELAAKLYESSTAEDKVHLQEIINLIDCYDPESWPRRREEERRVLEVEQRKEKEEREEKEKVFAEEQKKEKIEKQKAREEREEKEKVFAEEQKKEKIEKQKAREERETNEKQVEEERKHIESIQRDRQVYVDAANAILVGAALIASASFGAWLQPPLGFHPYYSPEFLDTNVPPPVGPVYEAFVPIQQYWSIHMFWIFNSLSFFFSLATVIAGADAALPQQVAPVQTSLQRVEDALSSVKKAVKRAAWLLVFAIGFVICTFATLGFTVLPPVTKYRINMMVTLAVGGLVCVSFLYKLVRKLISNESTP